MYKLLPLFIATIVIAYLAEKNSVYDNSKETYVKKDRVFLFILAIALAAFVGVRTSYNDTGTYIRGYEQIENSKLIFKGINWLPSGSPGFVLTQRILKLFGVSTQGFLMFFALVDVGISIWFVRKYTNNIWMSLFLFLTMGCYTFNMAAIMQCTANSIALIAIDKYISREIIAFVLLVLFAASFHTYAIIFIIVPLLDFSPWSKKTYWLFVIFGLVGIMLQSLLGVLVSLTTAMGESYDISSFSGDGVNLFRVLVVFVPVLLSFMARKDLNKSGDRIDNIMMNLSTINALIMFVALFGTANYFARMANYFLIFQTISLPWLFKFYNENSRKLLTIGTLIGYTLYFYYANGILYGGFDANYRGINLFEYILSVFRI